MGGPQEEEEHDEAGKCQDARLVVLGIDFVGGEQLGKVGSVAEAGSVMHVYHHTVLVASSVLVRVHGLEMVRYENKQGSRLT